MKSRPTLTAALGIIAFIAVLYGDILFAGRGFFLGDLTSYAYPMKHAVREVVFSGHFPYWNRHVSAGQPMAANPAYEVFYPPQWLVFLPSYRFGFQLHIIVHFAIAATGMLLLLRALGVRLFAAIFGAIAFILCGPYLSITNNLPLLFSISWAPLILYAVKRHLDEPSWARFFAAAGLFAVQWILGEPSIPLVTAILAAGYAIHRRQIRRLIPIAVAALLISAVQVLPAIDHARDSVRSTPFVYEIASNWSMPPSRLIELIVPSLFRHVQDGNGQPAIASMYPLRIDAFIREIYLGLFVAVLAIAGVVAGLRARWWFVAAFGVMALLSFGGHTPLMRLIHATPVLSSIRYPERFVVGLALVVIVWAAYVLDRLPRATRTIAILCAALAVILFLGAADHAWFGWNLVRAAALLALVFTFDRVPRPAWQGALLVLTAFDLWWLGRDATPRMPRDYFDAPPLVRSLPPPGDFRIYHEARWEWVDEKPHAVAPFVNRSTADYWRTVRNGLYPDLPEVFGYDLALAEDIDQTALKSTAEMLQLADTLRARDPASLTALLRMMNAGVILRFGNPLQAVRVVSWPRFALAEKIVRADASLHLPEALASRVAFVDIDPFTPAPGSVNVLEESPNTVRLKVDASAQTFVLLSVTGHKYWTATIDGAPARIQPANIALQGLAVPGGSHIVELRYRNPLILAGAVISALTLLALGLAAALRKPTILI